MQLPVTFLWVAVPASLIAIAVFTGIFDGAKTQVGLRHYAEKPMKSIPWLMPLNTAINGAYVLVGLYWINFASNNVEPKEQFFYFIFGWMAVIYGPAQLMRFLTQSHHWAIIDQYYTYPFFAWVIPWALHTQDQGSPTLYLAIILLSILSYGLTLVTPVGFEIGLGCHILGACFFGLKCYFKYPADESSLALCQAVLSCLGFVGLKLLDHLLPLIHPIFHRISGHFLSKICDSLQIHYVAMFFYTINAEKIAKFK